MTVTDSQRVRRELLLRSLFPTMPEAANLRFIDILEDLELPVGALAFAQGDTPDRFLFLTEGRVALETEGLPSIELSGFSVVGVVDAVLERPRLRACRALEPSKAFVIRAVDWFDLLEDNAEVARAAVKNFATRSYELWQQLVPRLPKKSVPPPGIAPSKLENYDKILALRQASFLRRAGMQAIASLAAIAETITLDAGEPLFEVGNHGEDFFIVASGSLELAHTSGAHFTHDTGDLVGGPAAFCNALPSFAARAQTSAVVLRISQQEFYDQAEEHGRLLRGILAFLASELESLQAITVA